MNDTLSLSGFLSTIFTLTATRFVRSLYTKPSITEMEVQYATNAAANGWVENRFFCIVCFEKEFKAHLGVNYAIGSSGKGVNLIMVKTNWIDNAVHILRLAPRSAHSHLP